VSNPPTGYQSVSPYLVTEDLEGLVGFVCNAFDGVDRHRATGAAGRTHVEVEVGDSLIMIGAGHLGTLGRRGSRCISTTPVLLIGALSRPVRRA
jgi:uncharacterized glyoxalase superfamily protein PhnB